MSESYPNVSRALYPERHTSAAVPSQRQGLPCRHRQNRHTSSFRQSRIRARRGCVRSPPAGYPAQFQRPGRVHLPVADSFIGKLLPKDEFGARAAVHVAAADEQNSFHYRSPQSVTSQKSLISSKVNWPTAPWISSARGCSESSLDVWNHSRDMV